MKVELVKAQTLDDLVEEVNEKIKGYNAIPIGTPFPTIVKTGEEYHTFIEWGWMIATGM